jgi:hypothetical protein
MSNAPFRTRTSVTESAHLTNRSRSTEMFPEEDDTSTLSSRPGLVSPWHSRPTTLVIQELPLGPF